MDDVDEEGMTRGADSGRRAFLRLAGAGTIGLALAPLLAACTPDLPHVVEIGDESGFKPGSLTIARGQTVVWKNVGTAPHSVTDDPAKASNKTNAALPEGASPWDSGPLYAGQTWSRTFDSPGRYLYFSSYDETLNRIGAITVTG